MSDPVVTSPDFADVFAALGEDPKPDAPLVDPQVARAKTREMSPELLERLLAETRP